MLKPTETSKKSHFFEGKIRLPTKYKNHCIVIEFYSSFIIIHQQNTASYKNLLHGINCYRIITLHDFLYVQLFCMNSIILKFSFWIKKLSPFFVCSYVSTIWFIVLNPLLVDVRLTASSRTLLYFAMGRSPESSKTRLFKPLLLNLNLSDLLS